MNLYEQPRPLLQQLGQESFAKSKRTLTSREIFYKRNKKKDPVITWGRVQLH